MEQIKLTATLACWVGTEYSLRGFTDAVAKGNHMAALDCVHFYGPPEREKFSDSTKVGTAEITMTVELARILEQHGAQSGMYLSEVRALRAEAERLAAQAAPTEPKHPLLNITAKQLRAALDFANPDPDDPDQLEAKVCIQWGEARDGGTEPAGLRAWLAECPEEGSISLDLWGTEGGLV